MTILAASSQNTTLAALFLDVAIIAACALAFGALARRVGQPVVVGEIVAGLLLGPSLLGLLPGNLDGVLFPAAVRTNLQALADVGLILFLFGVGFEVDLGRVRRSGRNALRVAAASVVVPAVAGIAIAPALWASHPPTAAGVSAVQFAAFVAIVLSVTALPVLARVLKDARLTDTPLGSIALVVSAMTDLVAWVALAILTATLGATEGNMPIGVVAVALPGFLLLLVLVVRPLLRFGLARSWCERPANASLLLLAGLALCAAATTALGLQPVFGAFAFGVACPRRSGSTPRPRAGAGAVRSGVHDPLERAAAGARLLSSAGLLLLPLYFIVTGLKVDVSSLGLGGAIEVGGLLVLATASKVSGVTWAAARSGFDRGGSLGLGLLLNTRGLTELVVLDIGHRAGVIDGELFTILVLVALLTTAMTMPLLRGALRIGRTAGEQRLDLRAGATELSGGR